MTAEDSIATYAARIEAQLLPDESEVHMANCLRCRIFWEGLPRENQQRLHLLIGLMLPQLIEDAKKLEWRMQQRRRRKTIAASSSRTH